MNVSATTRLGAATLVLMCSVAGAPDLRADPLLFHDTHYLVNSSPVYLDLFSNQGVVLRPSTYDGSIYPPLLIFGTFVHYAGGESIADSIRWTYQEQGAAAQVDTQAFTTGTSPINLGFVVGFVPTRQTGTPLPSSLTVDLLSSAPDFMIPSGPKQGQLVDSFTYLFATETPVPEPSTLALLLTAGLAAVPAVRRRMLRR